MQRWKQEFVGSSHRKCVQINRNGVFDQGKVMYVEPDWDCQDLLHNASQRLDIIPAAQIIFNADGAEIDDCMMICDDDILFFSKDEPFIAPEAVISENPERGKGEGERLPHSVGGYKVGELLGRGGFGEVRCGDHQLTGEKVALKFLRKAEIHSLGAAERTNTEIQCLATLKHHNIIKLYQHLETVDHVVLVFELMAGGDLLKFLLRRGGMNSTHTSVKLPALVPAPTTAAAAATTAPTGAGATAAPFLATSPPSSSGMDDLYSGGVGSERATNRSVLSEDEARHTFYQVLSAISYAHNQHICHRDLKLENILLKDHTLSLVKIADFGLSDFYRPGATMKSSCGTLSFLAPEVFKGTANAGPPLDVWSMGVILFAILCGRLPFEGPDLVGTKRPREQIIKSRIMKSQYKLDDSLGPEAKDLVRRMLQVDPSERASIPEIFNHAWVRPAVSGNLSDTYHLPSIAASAGSSRTNPEAGNLFPPALSSLVKQSSTTFPKDDDAPQESAEPISQSQSPLQKVGRHRPSLSMGSPPLGPRPTSNTRPASTSRSVLSSHNDLVELEATEEEAAMEQAMHLQSSPPLSARGAASGDPHRHSLSRDRLLSPSNKDSFSIDGKQTSFSGLDAQQHGEDFFTPGSHSSQCNSPLLPHIEESSPSLVSNKAFKLVPLRKQLSDHLAAASSDNSSPSSKLRSNSTSDALNAAGLSALQRPAVTTRLSSGQPSYINDFDDDDSYSTSSNWRNITLDPSPSTPALPQSSTSRKGITSSSKVSGVSSRRDNLAQSRASSSSSLNGGPSTSLSMSQLSTAPGAGLSSRERDKERIPPPPASSTMSRVAASALTSAAAAVASMTISGSRHRRAESPASGSSSSATGGGTGSGSGSGGGGGVRPLAQSSSVHASAYASPAAPHHGSVASNTGIAAISGNHR